MNNKIAIAEEAIELISDGCTLAATGFGTAGVAEEIYVQMEKKFLACGQPRDLTILHGAGQGNNLGSGLDHLAHEGMIRRIIGGHFASCPKLGRLITENKIEAYNFPQGVICHLYRAIAAKKPGEITKIGLKTFVDPRLSGGRINQVTHNDLVRVLRIDDEDWLFYPSLRIDIAVIRGTTADELGNVSMEDEAFHSEGLALAMAARASGGKVIVQVKTLVNSESIPAKMVHLPATLTDKIVICREPEKHHRQTCDNFFNPVLTGQQKVPTSQIAPLPLDDRKIIARRAALELTPDAVVNLGIGIPELVAAVAAEEKISSHITLTVESGPTGGIPGNGGNFGAAVNPWALIDQTSQFDFYDGGGLDIAFLGLAQVNRRGDVNVSKFGGKIAGCGGFINISQNTRRLVFCGKFTNKGLNMKIEDGQLIILKEGTLNKFVNAVEQITFNSENIPGNYDQVLYVTERAVFTFGPEGLVLTEIAPGINLEKDILSQMEFAPILSPDLRLMDPRIFKIEPMGLDKNFTGKRHGR
ncbi:MAG: CoA-transferase [Fibrobacterota bacterium]